MLAKSALIVVFVSKSVSLSCELKNSKSNKSIWPVCQFGYCDIELVSAVWVKAMMGEGLDDRQASKPAIYISSA